MIARISIALFFGMAYIYKGYGDYYSVVWDSVFWIGMYFLIAALCLEKYTRARVKFDEYLYLFTTIYFGFMMLTSVICLFSKDLHDKLVINTEEYTWGMIAINVLLIIFIIELSPKIKKQIVFLFSKIKPWLKKLGSKL